MKGVIREAGTREQVRPVIYEQMKREEAERKTMRATLDAIDREVVRVAGVTLVPDEGEDRYRTLRSYYEGALTVEVPGEEGNIDRCN